MKPISPGSSQNSTDLPSGETQSFVFRTHDDAKKVLSKLSPHCGGVSRLEVGLFELMANAIEHGNLNIGYDLKSHHLDQGDYYQEIERRLALPEYCERVARLKFERLGHKLIFTISDEGTGFDWERYVNAQSDISKIKHGRGLVIADQISHLTLRYKGNGNTVVATIQLDNDATS